jgi:Flp pilus assembly protein TadG
MLPPLIRRTRSRADFRSRQHGFTMALVTVALVAIIGMAALSIDIGTLYQAKAEAQRAADAGALAAARVISISGITGDPKNANGSWASICDGATSPASLTATTVAQQNLIAGVAVPSGSVKVMYGVGGTVPATTDCSTLAPAFAVNPVVSVNVQRPSLPIFFARVFSLIPGSNYNGASVSATATAEVFNPSDSGKGAAVAVPVQPRCVKPWIVANQDPGNSLPAAKRFIARNSGKIVNEGISPLGGGVIGEPFFINADCVPGATDCEPANSNLQSNPPIWNSAATPRPFLEYIPALVLGTPSAVPKTSACSVTGYTATGYQAAIAGCDQTTVYTCGTPSSSGSATLSDLTLNPGGVTGDSSIATQCLINYPNQDSLAGGTPPTFPFQILAGPGSPLLQATPPVSAGDIVTTSNSIVTIPVADFTGVTLSGTQPAVSIVGFLQVFINSVDTTTTGNISVTVLNVSGCGEAATGPPVYGTSPVPVRLITPPSS